ncbi:MAG TPA: LysM peptidoglycan-binding domain-containing protein [Candidatus Paceibacterota bacterium]|nr:LysM peptidoglycan-binding domain-containing protein [Verrucomicrobiota bacterium]HRY49902.1 LysM peptidoglycan-binding domain-containing protein [Candidatus Paceibacterota bacterium]HSA01371.1 LysM peptidoglycan-binding domain-containing protein [Candidatus Paceibacterota bacterium]
MMKILGMSLLLVVGILQGPLCVLGQDAEAIAARQELDERLRRLESAVEQLQAAQMVLQKRTAQVSEEIQNLRTEIARKPNDAVSHDDLRSLEKKLQELNEKREADKRLILDQFEKLAKAPPVVLPSSSTSARSSAPSFDPNQPGYEYEVQSGDTLSSIVSDFNKEFKAKGIKGRITVEQVMNANNIKRASDLRSGKKIFIPEPSRKP